MMNRKMNMALALLALACTTMSVTAEPLNTRFTVLGQHDQEDQLTLNNGKRWKANKETTTGVNEMLKLMQSFTPSESSKDYNKLSKAMRTEMNSIFEHCSMKGKAHDNLHTFLVPILGDLKDMEANDIATCQTAHASLKKQLALYEVYFE